MKDSQLKSTREALKQLFEIEGIKQVICVDDEYRDVINDVIGHLEIQESGSLQQISKKIHEFGDIVWENEDIWKDQVREIWDAVDIEDLERFYEHLNFSKDDNGYPRALRAIMKPLEGVNFKELSFNDWKKASAEYLGADTVKQTLFLFDQDLSKEGGSDKEGINIIRKLLVDDPQIICGLLSHTFRASDEYTTWKEFAKEYDIIDENRFVLIAKERLHKDNSGFARMVRLPLLSKHCKTLNNKVSDIIKNTYEKSEKKIDSLNLYDFEHIVFHSSNEEGIREVDTLFRLYNLYQKHSALQMAFDDEELLTCTDSIREIRNIQIGDIEKQISELWKIQRLELYEEEKYINRLHKPIELGDIFQKTNGGAKYILLSQPCDLTVRENGKRKNFEGVLAKIVSKRPSKDVFSYELLYFDEKTGESYYVDFRDTHTVLLCILDLCVYNNDGIAKMMVDGDCPDSVMPSWNKRFRILNDKGRKIFTRYKEQQDNGLKKHILDLLLPKSSHDKSGLFKANVDRQKGKESITYDCRRIGKLCMPMAGAMLTKYAHYISRSAFEHDFEESRKKRIPKEKT